MKKERDSGGGWYVQGQPRQEPLRTGVAKRVARRKKKGMSIGSFIVIKEMS